MSEERNKPLRIVVAEILAGDDMTDAAVESLRSAKDFYDIRSKEFMENRILIYAKLADKVIKIINDYQMKESWENDEY